MEVGIIAPTSLLTKCCKTDIQYCLPSLLLNNKKYQEFYKSREARGDLVILDSKKLGWKRVPEELETIKQALKILPKSLLVLPSYMFETARTITITRDALQTLKPRSIAGCLEGTSKKEVEDCAANYKALGIRTLAIPSHLLSFLKAYSSDWPLLYLDNRLKLEELEGPEGTLVTSLPVRLGLEGRLVSDHLPSPKGLTFDEPVPLPGHLKTIEKNIQDTIRYYEAL